MNKLVVCLMGQDSKDFLEICLKSVEDADAIVFCDGGSKPEFIEWLTGHEQNYFCLSDINDENHGHIVNCGHILIQQEFKQDDPQMNGKQRNFYLDFLKKNYAGWWCLCLDADEVLHDGGIEKIKAFLASQENDWFDVKMRHLFHNLRYEDATRPLHYVPRRLFKVREELHYPLGEHQPLTGLTVPPSACDATTIWHLAYASQFHVRSRYRKNLKHSKVHDKNYLDQWYKSHLFGKYPITEVDPKDLPRVLLEGMDVDPDEIYFQGRGLEVKHFIDAAHWKQYFQPRHAIEFGCGMGPRVVALRMVGVEKTLGIELSKWAVEHRMIDSIIQGDITNLPETWDEKGLRSDLVIAYDLLEHIPYDKLEKAINNLIANSGKHVLISVPVLGDPNLLNDPTHIIKESKDWWKGHFLKKGCKELVVPSHFQYREQLMIFEVSA